MEKGGIGKVGGRKIGGQMGGNGVSLEASHNMWWDLASLFVCLFVTIWPAGFG